VGFEIPGFYLGYFHALPTGELVARTPRTLFREIISSGPKRPTMELYSGLKAPTPSDNSFPPWRTLGWGTQLEH
jgi:hypothetical protein